MYCHPWSEVSAQNSLNNPITAFHFLEFDHIWLLIKFEHQIHQLPSVFISQQAITFVWFRCVFKCPIGPSFHADQNGQAWKEGHFWFESIFKHVHILESTRPSIDFVFWPLSPRDTWCIHEGLNALTQQCVLFTDRQTANPHCYMFWYKEGLLENWKLCPV